MRNGSTNQSEKILATSEDFVPTAFDLPDQPPETGPVDWQIAIKKAIRSSAQLREAVGLPRNAPETTGPDGKLPCEHDFRTFAPLEFVSLMRAE